MKRSRNNEKNTQKLLQNGRKYVTLKIDKAIQNSETY